MREKKKKEKTNGRISRKIEKTAENLKKKQSIPIRAYVPSGMATLKPVGTRAFPRAGTVTAATLQEENKTDGGIRWKYRKAIKDLPGEIITRR